MLAPIKVDKNVKPLHFSERQPIQLTIGGNYFVSFGNNKAYSCTIVEMEERRNAAYKSVLVSIPGKGTYLLLSDEIGKTPEEAVINTVTF